MILTSDTKKMSDSKGLKRISDTMILNVDTKNKNWYHSLNDTKKPAQKLRPLRAKPPVFSRVSGITKLRSEIFSSLRF